MNRIYKTIWNESIRAWVAVHENAAACGKSTRSTRRRVARGLLALGVAATGFTAATPGAHAQTVVSGGANNAPSGKTASVDQSCGQNFVDRSNPGNTSNGNTYVLTNGCSTAVGNNASAQTAGVALGDRASAAQGGVALGVGARAVQGNSGVAIGPVALSSGNTSIAIGRQSAANGDYSMALGNVAYAKGESGIALGHSALADGYRSIAIGASDSRAAGNDGVSNGANYNPATQTRASGTNAVSLGAGAVTSVDDSVAIGSNSVGVANATGPAKFSGDAIASTGAVSVGKAGSERQIRNVAGGTAGTDAVNVNQLTAVSDSAVKYDTNPDGSVNYGSVTLNPGGAPAKLGNVAAGDVSATSTDAVNGSQLHQTNQTVNNQGDSTASVIGGGASYDPATGKVTGPTYNIAGGQQTTISDAINALNQGWNVTTSGNASGTSVTAIKPGDTMTVDGGKNIALTQDGSKISIATSDTPTFTSVGIDNGGPVLSGSGLDMSGQKITNVAPGDVSATSTDAVNGSQLHQTNQTVNNQGDSTASVIGGGASYDPATGKVTGPTYNIAGGQQTTISDAINTLNQGWNVTTSGNASGTSVTAVKPGDTMTVDGGKNIALTQDGSKISIATSDTPTFTSVGIDNGGPVLSGSGLDMANQKITNVAPGDVSATSTDAVNGSQLHQTNQTVNNQGDSTASAIGGGASYDPATGKVTGPTYNIAGGQQTTISDAINTLNQGWNVTTSGNASGTSVTAIKPGDTMTVDGGKNIALTQDGSKISIATSDTPTFTSVGIDNGGPVLSGSGLDMSGQKITNVAPGDVSATSTDAVNGSQLNDTNQKIKQASDQAVKYDTNPDGSVNYGSVTLNPGGSPAKLGNVAAGDVSATSTDAVNGSQLHQTNQTVNNQGDSTASVIGGGASYDPATGKVTGPTYNIAGGQQTTISDAINTLNQGWNVTTSGNASGTSVTAIKPGDTMTVDGGKNIALTQDGSKISIATSDTPTFTSVGIDNGGPVLSASGLDMANQKITHVAPGEVSSTSADAVNGSQLNDTNQKVQQVSDQAVKYDTNPDGSINYNSVTLNPGGSPAKLGNVAAGDVSATSTDAVNGSQLHQTNQTVNNQGSSTASVIGGGASYDPATGKVTGPTYNIAGSQQTTISDAINALNQGWNVTTSGNASGTSVTAIKPGDTMTIDGGKNIALTQDGSKISIATSDTPTFTSVGIDNGGPVLSGSGLDMANQKITNVAPGDVSATSTDAVNGSQLHQTNQTVNNQGDSTASVIGGGASYDPATGKVTGPTYNIAGGQQTTISDAINTLNQGWNVTTSGNASGTSVTAVKPGDTMTVDGGKNIALTQDGSKISIATSDTPTFTSVGIDNGGPVLSGSGLAMANQKITNVAPGDVSATSTDAVNGSQLNDTNQKVQQASDQAVKYDTNPDGSVNYNSVTLNPGGSPAKLGNVAAGDVSQNSTDAVNGSQLYETNQNVTKLGDTLTNIAGDTSQSYTDQNGMGIRYARTNEAGLAQTDAFAQSPGSTAVGYAATASADNALAIGRETTASHAGSVALGANAIANGATLGNAAYNPGTGVLAGTNPVGEVSLGSSGAERRITNVAAGAEDTDAVNVSQLKALQSSVGDVSDRAVKYDGKPGDPKTQITLEGPTSTDGGKTGGTKLTNVAQGDVSATSTDAVNGSQLHQTNQTVNNQGDSTASVIGGGASYDPATGKVTGPTYNIAGGQQTTISDAINALNQGWNVTTSGNASGTSVTAIKPGDTMTVDGGKNIALTQDGSKISIATSDTPTFTSVGIDNGGPVLSGSGLDMANQKITNVTPGDVSATSTDAVNGSQLNDTNQKVKQASDQAVKYDTNPDGSVNYNSVTLNPGGSPAKLGNVAAGDVSQNSTDAVNGSQLYETNQNVTKLGDTLTNIAGDTSQSYTDQNGMGIRYARTNEAGLAQTDAFAQSPGSTAVGYAATASADNALALGRETTASHAGSVALGANAIANGATLGNAAYNPGTGVLAGTNPVGEVSLGSSGAERRITNVAAGAEDTDAVNVSQLKTLQSSVGDVSDRAVKYDGKPGDPKTQITLEGPASTDGGKTGGTKLTNVAQGDVSATSTDAVNGSQLNDTNQNVTKLGDTLTNIAGDTSQSYTDQNGMGIRYARTNEAGLAQTDAFAQAPGSTAVGYAATASADNALALGRETTASHAGSVALGANAIANGATLGNAAYNPGTGTLAGTNPVGEVSIGSSGAERRITNVAAGAEDTDAVNVSQLKSVEANLGDLSAGAVKYDRNPDGSIDYTHVTMNPGGAPTTITNVAAGELSATSTDAVNGSQLYETNQNVTRLGDQVDNIANGGGIKYFHANGGATPLPDSRANGAGSTAMGPAANANGANSVAVGNGAVANKDGDVALGGGAVADRGSEHYTGKYSNAQNDTAGTVSVGSAGHERTISNVADGREATDAVNVRQLDGAVQEAKDWSKNYTDESINKVAGDVVQVGDKLDKLGDRVTNVEGDVTKIKNGSGGMFQVSQDQTPVAPSASGSNAVAGGAGAVASGANSTALGNQASATGSSSTAVGNGAKASGNNAVALGAGSDGSRDNAVSVGAVGQERQIVNVAPGTAGTDAVNVNQLHDMARGLGGQIAGVRSDMQSMDHRLTAGVAAAMAMAGLPQAYLPGRSMVALGGGTWRGESGVALGLSTVSDNGNWVMKGSASSSSRGDIGASVGVGYQW
ncbi:YadA-like family protein [Burkholderia anthina]|uniref:YadA-like family protein n=1 Tax=Burkholderia anthina TaxID=179879 RepID=UPI00158D1357|nr:YadA-like family protein [Burkholderia anthina]